MRIDRRDWLGLAAVTVVLLAWWLQIMRLFPQVEFMEWIASPARPMLRDGVEAMASFRADGFSRHVSLMWAAVTGRACGTDIVCINSMAFLPVVAGAFLFYALARKLRLPPAAAVGILLVWLVSQPTFEILTWQATLHDRLASTFVPGLLLLTLIAARKADLRAIVVVPWAIALLITAGLAMNTKEPAWIVLPMLAASPLLLATTRRQAAGLGLIVAPAVVWMTIHVITDLHALNDDPASAGHVKAGSLSENLPKLTDFAIPGGLVMLLVLCIPAIAGVVLAVARRRERPEAMQAARWTAWLAIGAIGGWIIPARTEFASAFYMYVPIAIAGLTLASGWRAGLLAREPLQRAGRMVVGVAGTALVAWCVGISASDRWELYGDVVTQDAAFRESLPAIAAAHQAHPEASFQFRMPYPYGYRFVTAGQAARFWRLVGDQLNTPDFNFPITSVPEACGVNGTIILRYDERTRFLDACAAAAP